MSKCAAPLMKCAVCVPKYSYRAVSVWLSSSFFQQINRRDEHFYRKDFFVSDAAFRPRGKPVKYEVST